MSKRKQQLQVDIKSNEDWESYIQTPGLKVVDAYTEWCGPCVALTQTMRKNKLELSDELLTFATANSNKVDALSSFSGTSRPTILFYGGEVLVDVQQGADGPALSRRIKQHLHNEHEAIENGKERVAYEGTLASAPAQTSDAAAPARAKSAAEVKSFTFALIKPTAVAEGHADDIFASLAEGGFKVAAQDEKQLSSETVAAFYAEHKGKEFFDNLVEQISSGPVKPLVLSKSGDDAVAAWRKFIGPTNPEAAKQEAPESIRAKFGTDVTQNAVHGSDSDQSAAREILFFFPDWAKEHLPVSHAVVEVKPEAAEKVDDVEQLLKGAGFKVQTKTPKQPADGDDETPAASAFLLASRVAAERGVLELAGPADAEAGSCDSTLRGIAGPGVLVPDSAEDALALVQKHFPNALAPASDSFGADQEAPPASAAAAEDDTQPAEEDAAAAEPEATDATPAEAGHEQTPAETGDAGDGGNGEARDGGDGEDGVDGEKEGEAPPLAAEGEGETEQAEGDAEAATAADPPAKEDGEGEGAAEDSPKD
eukprot:m.169275 g.169275  ORF g.169275 m.169275 type:complete len:538 (-) comp17802_c1_seq3:45-1658(-)